MITLFLDDKTFHGCAGLQITDEMRVIIAAEACLLLLNRKTDIYPRLQRILFIRMRFALCRIITTGMATISVANRDMLGESWHYGKVILSWDDVKHGVANFSDGHNVVLHEFSHQLDSENGAANGAPILRRNSIQCLGECIVKRVRCLERSCASATGNRDGPVRCDEPRGIFAVATETFFEKPTALEQSHPALYAELAKYYCVNPQD